VQDHLSTMFDKVGVRGRRAMVARIFMDHYWQSIAEGRLPSRRGGFPAC
jgi:hypothetical protein